MNYEKFRLQLIKVFDLSELKDISFDLGIDYENLEHHRKSDFARELIRKCERVGKIVALQNKCRKLRPNLTWNFSITTISKKGVKTSTSAKLKKSPKKIPCKPLVREDINQFCEFIDYGSDKICRHCGWMKPKLALLEHQLLPSYKPDIPLIGSDFKIDNDNKDDKRVCKGAHFYVFEADMDSLYCQKCGILPVYPLSFVTFDGLYPIYSSFNNFYSINSKIPLECKGGHHFSRTGQTIKCNKCSEELSNKGNFDYLK